MRTAVFLTLLSSVAASAAAQTTTDQRVWATALFQGHLHPKSKWRWSVEANLKTKNDARDVDTLLAPRGIVGYDVTPRLNIGGGYAEVTKYNSGTRSQEHRYFGQLSWTPAVPVGTLGFRTRLEDRDIDGNDGMAVRLREQARYSHPFAPKSKYSLVTYDEIFFHLNGTLKYARGLDQNRAFAGIGRAI